tara:strand:+ start:269 stop:475 length:207 start_codon:yes stop_codon:yes gene_type:complete
MITAWFCAAGEPHVACHQHHIDLAKGKYWQPEEEEEAVGQNGSQFASQVQYMNNSILLGQLNKNWLKA